MHPIFNGLTTTGKFDESGSANYRLDRAATEAVIREVSLVNGTRVWRLQNYGPQAERDRAGREGHHHCVDRRRGFHRENRPFRDIAESAEARLFPEKLEAPFAGS